MGLTGDAAGNAARQQVPVRAALAKDAHHKDEGGVIVFAAALAIIAGALNFIYGLTYIVKDEYAGAVREALLFSNLKFWGWLILLVGIGQVIIGLGLLTGNWVARIAGIAWSVIAALGALTLLGTQPFLAIVLLGLNVLILHALSTNWRGQEFGG